ncbi:helix-turn-helix domain-containing protein [Chryseobacterium tructae]|uniref:helix-turn-helix domain-containing protein n=1 Tax=Chryseobacterium tructae TaxID=1037380 RepID=UPI0025B3A4E8|nr:helix-turn-helix domain-containing protein [Chryseobacterium tructae]MDN3694997.1 helix-turn-helix domain-containing protein [Chryseobacterium tructae]
MLLSDEGKELLKSVITETIKAELKKLLEEKNIYEILQENPSNKSKQGAIKDQFLTRKETSALLKVSLVTLSNWQRSQTLIPHKIGKRVLYKKEDVETAMLKQNSNPKI